MAIFVDARIPVVFAAATAAGKDDALLIEGEVPAAGAAATFRLPEAHRDHPAACSCCAPRGAVAEALSRLFLARARAEVPFFRRVVVAAGPEAAVGVRAAVASDAFLSGRYRLAT